MILLPSRAVIARSSRSVMGSPFPFCPPSGSAGASSTRPFRFVKASLTGEPSTGAVPAGRRVSAAPGRAGSRRRGRSPGGSAPPGCGSSFERSQRTWTSTVRGSPSWSCPHTRSSSWRRVYARPGGRRASRGAGTPSGAGGSARRPGAPRARRGPASIPSATASTVSGRRRVRASCSRNRAVSSTGSIDRGTASSKPRSSASRRASIVVVAADMDQPQGRPSVALVEGPLEVDRAGRWRPPARRPRPRRRSSEPVEPLDVRGDREAEVSPTSPPRATTDRGRPGRSSRPDRSSRRAGSAGQPRRVAMSPETGRPALTRCWSRVNDRPVGHAQIARPIPSPTTTARRPAPIDPKHVQSAVPIAPASTSCQVWSMYVENVV